MLNEALTFLTETALPAFESLMEDLGPIVAGLVDDYIRPLVDSVGELFSVFTEGEGSINILALAFKPLELALLAIRTLIDAIVFGLKLIGIGKGSGAAQALSAAAAGAGYGGSSFVNTMNAGGGGGNAAALGSTYIIPVTIGTGKVDTVVAHSIKRIGPGTRRGR
jgi:hypothetical protein